MITNLTVFSDIKIGSEQAQKFARSVYSDIAEYIKTHQDEYKRFQMINDIKNTTEVN